MMTNCDMCGTKIQDGKCDCGEWKTPEEMKDNPIKLAIEHFHEMKKFIISTDAPHLGSAAVFFRGDYTDCQEVINFIHKMKKKPYYE